MDSAFSAVDKRWISVIEALKSRDVSISVLTNNWFTTRKGKHSGRERTNGLDEKIFNGLVLESCRLGVRKPDKRIFEILLERLKVLP